MTSKLGGWFRSKGVTLSEAEVALTYEPRPFHIDIEAVTFTRGIDYSEPEDDC